MTIYLLTFTLSVVFFYFAERLKQRGFRWLFYAIAAVIPSLLAGFRDETVGIDVLNYVSPYWNYAQHASGFSSFLLDVNTEKGYALFNFVLAKFFVDIHYLFFFHQLLIMVFVLLIAHKYKDRFESSFILIFYFLFFYLNTYCAMRQAMCNILVLYASTFMFEKNKMKWFVLWALTGFSFHDSGIFAFILPILVYITGKYEKKMLLVYVGTIAGTVVLVEFYQIILGSLMGVGVLSAKYANYLNQTGFSTHKINLFVEIFMFLIVKWNIRKSVQNFYFTRVLTLFLLMSFCLEMMGGMAETASRVVTYFFLPVMFIMPLSIVNKRKQNLIMVAYSLVLLGRFVYFCVMTNANKTLPYTSKILGILG